MKMTMEIKTIDQAIEFLGVKICVYGPAGSGKTVLATTCGAPTLIMSAESGLLSIRNIAAEIKQRVGIIEIKNNHDVGNAYERLSNEKLADWLVIDSGSEICETLLASKKKGAVDPRKAYGEMADEFLEMLRLFRDIPHYNVLMTFKQGRVKDEVSGITKYAPMLPGKQAEGQIPYMFDEVFALRVEPDAEGNMVRILQTGLDISYDCKDRSGSLEMFEIANIEHIAKKIDLATNGISQPNSTNEAPLQSVTEMLDAEPIRPEDQ
jgi:hypothetical protein